MFQATSIIAIICSIGLPVIVAGLVIMKAISSNKKERLELARQGIIPPPETKTAPNKYQMLRNGFLCLGLALGLIIGVIITIDMNIALEHQYMIIAGSTIFGIGLAYISFYMAVRNKKELDEDSE
ncbi:MAG: DUF6249 domain-containing protein [Dysgonomonas sp.]